MKDSEMDNIKNSIEWKKYPDPPLPGLYRMDMQLKIDTRQHDGSIDDDFRKIHTSFTKFFPIDVLEELKKIENPVNETWLRQSEQIDDMYYREQSDRRALFKRAKEHSNIDDLKNYQESVKDSFEDVEKPVDGYDIVEEYPLFPAREDLYVLISGEVRSGEGFMNDGSESTLVDRCIVDHSQYECMKQRSGDNIIIEIKDDKAYYSIAQYLYKFKRVNNRE